MIFEVPASTLFREAAMAKSYTLNYAGVQRLKGPLLISLLRGLHGMGIVPRGKI